MGLIFPAHIHACLANDHFVFLDERADTYSALSPDLAPAFKRLLAGEATEEDTRAIGGQLVSTGLMDRTPNPGDTPEINQAVRPTFGQAEEPTHLQLSPKLVTCLTTRWYWGMRARYQRPWRYFRALRQRKAQLITRLEALPPLDHAVFHAKPMLDTRWLVPTHDKCLPWSMAMADWLMRQDVPAEVVIGVKMKPFGAHAWVEYRGAVLSDVYDNVTPFTPILAL